MSRPPERIRRNVNASTPERWRRERTAANHAIKPIERCPSCKWVGPVTRETMENCRLPRKHRELWRECVQNLHLFFYRHPTDPLLVRHRMEWIVQGERRVFCALWGPVSDTTCTTILAPEEILRQWSVKRTLKKNRGTFLEMDLRNIPKEIRGQCRISPDDKHRSYLTRAHPMQLRNKWSRRIRDWCEKHSFPIERLVELENAANPVFGWDSPSDRRRKRATLWVPFDLRRGIDKTWIEVKPHIERTQEILLELSGRRRAIADRGGEKKQMAVYCYLRRYVEGAKATVIAAEDFGHMDLERASSMIRTKALLVRKALKAHGLA